MRFFTVSAAVLFVLATAAPKVAFADEAAVEELKLDEKSSVAGAAAQAALNEYNNEYYNAGGRNVATPLTVAGALAALAGLAFY